MRDNIKHALAAEVQDLSSEFRRSQESYLHALQQRKEKSNRTLENSKKPSTAEDVALSEFGAKSGGGGNNSNIAVEGDLTQLEIALDTGVYEEAVERDRELRNVAKSIKELSDIFRDLAILVIDQGTALDRIDCNLESAQDNTRQAVVHLESANNYSKGARLRNFILILLALILVMVVILVVRLGVRRR